MPNEVRIIVLTKVPIAGQVKTRLIPAMGPDGACRLHTAMARETVARLKTLGLPITLSVSGPLDHPFVMTLRPCVDAVEPQVPAQDLAPVEVEDGERGVGAGAGEVIAAADLTSGGDGFADHRDRGAVHEPGAGVVHLLLAQVHDAPHDLRVNAVRARACKCV